MKTTLLSTILLLITLAAAAQTGTIKGRVLTSDGKPAAFVTVGLEGSKIGAITGENGTYQLERIKPGPYTVKVTAVGVLPQEKSVNVVAGQVINVDDIQLEESASRLSEVVVAGERNAYKSNDVSNTLRIKTAILETPQNIQVMSNRLLADQQITDMLEGVTRNVSGMSRGEHWDNYARIYMRGSNIPAFRNGMNVSMPFGPLTEDMSMVERIEVIKGPAGFMASSGEPGGMYNVVTKKPTGVNKGEVSLTLGSYDLYRATLDLDGKLNKSGTLLGRINVMGQNKNSFQDLDYNNRYSIAPVLSYKLDDRTTLTAEYNFQYVKAQMIGANYQFSRNGWADPKIPRGQTTSAPSLEPTKTNDHNLFLNLNHQINKDWSVTAQVLFEDYKQRGASAWPVVPPDAAGFMQRGISIWDTDARNKLGQIFINGEVKTGPVVHRLLGGIDVGDKEQYADYGAYANVDTSASFNIYAPVYTATANPPAFDHSLPVSERTGDPNRYVDQNFQSYKSVFVQDELRFWQEKIRLTLAGRYTYSVDRNVNPYANTAIESKKFSPRVGLSVSVDRNTAVYGLFDQSFIPTPGYDHQKERPFIPVTGNNYEVGIKRDWFDGRWRSTVAAYTILRNNVATADPQNPTQWQVQLGQTKTRGVEVDITGQLARGLDLTANYAFTESQISKDETKSNIGQMTPGTIKNLANAWLSYRLTETKLKGVGISLGAQYQGGRYAWYSFSGETPLEDYFRMDGAISYQGPKYTISFNVNNLLDKYLYSGSTLLDGNSQAYYFWIPEAPRNFRLNVAYRF